MTKNNAVLTMRENQQVALSYDEIKFPLISTLSVNLITTLFGTISYIGIPLFGIKPYEFFFFNAFATLVLGIWLFFTIGFKFRKRNLYKPPVNDENKQILMFFGSIAVLVVLGSISYADNGIPPGLMWAFIIVGWLLNLIWIIEKLRLYQKSYKNLKTALNELAADTRAHPQILHYNLSEEQFLNFYSNNVYFLYFPNTADPSTVSWVLLKKDRANDKLLCVFFSNDPNINVGRAYTYADIRKKVLLLPHHILQQKLGFWVMENIKT